jgi:hypothetical protein
VASPSEILDAARARRPRTPRWLWVIALSVGAVCLGAFAYAVLVEPGTPDRAPLTTSSGTGFGAGILIGLVMGIGIGLAIARQRRAHSSRKSP